jgi:hypothetical protein
MGFFLFDEQTLLYRQEPGNLKNKKSTVTILILIFKYWHDSILWHHMRVLQLCYYACNYGNHFFLLLEADDKNQIFSSIMELMFHQLEIIFLML